MAELNHRAQAVVRLIRAHQQAGVRGRRRRLPRQVPPTAIEREYARAIKHYVALVRAALGPLVRELPGLLERAAAERRHDSSIWRSFRTDAGEAARIQALIQAAREQIARTVNTAEVERIARLFGQRTATHQRIQLNSQVRAALGVDLFGAVDSKLAVLLDGFAAENAALVTSVPLDVITGVEKAANRAMTTGVLWEDLRDELEEKFAFGESRAELIARDQIGKINGQINASRQRSLGVTKYTWRTVHDERVRSEHVDLDGKVFEYGDPEGGDDGMIPGVPIQCRCSAEPWLDDILGASD